MLIATILWSLLTQVDATPKDEYLYLNRYFDIDGFKTDASDQGRIAPGTNSSAAFASDSVIPAKRVIDVATTRFGTIKFLRPKTDGDNNNFVACRGQRIPVRTKNRFNALFSLGTAHHGEHAGWIEFEFESGKKKKGPIGFSDWYGIPSFGEEVAFNIPPPSGVSTLGGGCKIWSQYTPIPLDERVIAIRLPNRPSIKIMALTLGKRDGIEAILPPRTTKPEPALVAVFGAKGYPRSHAVSYDLSAEQIAEHIRELGISARVLNRAQLADPKILTPENFPVLIHPYGRGIPGSMIDSIRSYRQAGGCMVHTGPAFVRATRHSPYGGWTWLRNSSSDEGERAVRNVFNAAHANYLGMGTAIVGGQGDLTATALGENWGLGDLPWNKLRPDHGWTQKPAPFVLAPTTFPEGARIQTLVSYGGDEKAAFAAAIHRPGGDDPFKGVVDVIVGLQNLWYEGRPVGEALWTPIIARSAAWILHSKKKIDDATWKAASASLDPAKVLPKALAVGASSAKELPSLPPLPNLIHVVTPRSPAEHVLVASAQGLVNRRPDAALLSANLGLAANSGRSANSGSSAKSSLVKKLRALGTHKLQTASFEQVFELIGHRRAVVVDPLVYGSLNLAQMVAAQESLLVAYPSMLAQHGLEVAADLRGLFKTNTDMLRFAIENLLPAMNDSPLAFCPPIPEAAHFRDYLAATRSITLWLPSRDERSAIGSVSDDEYPLIEKVLAARPIGSSILGSLGDGRFRGVHRDGAINWISSLGQIHVPLDRNHAAIRPEGSENLSILARLPKSALPRSSSTKNDAMPEEGKIYLAIMPQVVNLQDAVTGSLPRYPSTLNRKPTIALESIRLLNLAPGLGSLLGSDDVQVSSAMVPGPVDVEHFAQRFAGDSKQKLADVLIEGIEKAREHGLESIMLRSNGRLRQALIESELATKLPEATIFVPQHAEENLGLHNLAYRLGNAVLIHETPVETLTLAAQPGATSDMLKTLAPHFYAASPSAIASLGPTLPPDVELVSPSEFARLFRAWSSKRRITSTQLITAKATWRYNDEGKDLGKDWTATDYDDSAWSEGKGIFGYGDSRETTTLSFGDDSDNKTPCYYFRKTFDIDSVSKHRMLLIEVLRDDGVVVYLNGKEVARDNLPEGDIGYATMAGSTIGSSAETKWNTFLIEGKHLRKGKNTISVELHQASSSSSDLGFNLKLSSSGVEAVE